MIHAKITGLDKVLKNMDKYYDYMDAGMQLAMERVAEIIAEKARANAPVDTGKLQNSIKAVVKKITEDLIEGTVTAEVEYAKHIEFGTSDMRAQPFMVPAIEEGIKYLKIELEKAHKRAAQRLR